MIPRKWEWTEEQCHKRNFLNAARMAREIDNVLLECYSFDHTEAWLSLSKTFDFDALAPYEVFMDIVGESTFCTACMNSDSCENCCFRKIAGVCGDRTSLYNRFLAEIWWIWHKEEKGVKRK